MYICKAPPNSWLSFLLLKYCAVKVRSAAAPELWKNLTVTRKKCEIVMMRVSIFDEVESLELVLEMAAFFCWFFFFFVPTCLPPPLRKWRMDVINPPPSPVGTRDVLRHVSFPFIVTCCKAWDCREPQPEMKWQPLSVTRNRCVTTISV